MAAIGYKLMEIREFNLFNLKYIYIYITSSYIFVNKQKQLINLYTSLFN